MTSLTFYGGVNKINVNKILFGDKDIKIFLDFGMSFGKRGNFLEEFISTRASNGSIDISCNRINSRYSRNLSR